jgi:hypothetical protein
MSEEGSLRTGSDMLRVRETEMSRRERGMSGLSMGGGDREEPITGRCAGAWWGKGDVEGEIRAFGCENHRRRFSRRVAFGVFSRGALDACSLPGALLYEVSIHCPADEAYSLWY